MPIAYRLDGPLDGPAYTDLLRRSTLGERRPIDNPACIAGMVANATLTVTAWDGDLLVGVARSLTDWCYACYLSDLAVDEAYQRQGIGRELIQRTQRALLPTCNLILLAAPAAHDYYAHLGFDAHSRAWYWPSTKPPL